MYFNESFFEKTLQIIGIPHLASFSVTVHHWWYGLFWLLFVVVRLVVVDWVLVKGVAPIISHIRNVDCIHGDLNSVCYAVALEFLFDPLFHHFLVKFFEEVHEHLLAHDESLWNQIESSITRWDRQTKLFDRRFPLKKHFRSIFLHKSLCCGHKLWRFFFLVFAHLQLL